MGYELSPLLVFLVSFEGKEASPEAFVFLKKFCREVRSSGENDVLLLKRGRDRCYYQHVLVFELFLEGLVDGVPDFHRVLDGTPLL